MSIGEFYLDKFSKLVSEMDMEVTSPSLVMHNIKKQVDFFEALYTKGWKDGQEDKKVFNENIRKQ